MKKQKLLWIGIAVIAVIFLLFLSQNSNKFQKINCNYPEQKINNSCCVDNNLNNLCDNQEKASFNINNIQISMEGDKNVDVYAYGEGGPVAKKNFIEVTNNNPEEVCFKIYCLSEINAFVNYNEFDRCSPSLRDFENRNSNLCIKGNSKDISEIVIRNTGTENSYNANIKIDLAFYWDEIKKEFVNSEQSLKVYPLTINSYNLLDSK